MFDRDSQPHRSAAQPTSGRSTLRHDVRRRSARNGMRACVRRRDRHGIVLVFVVVLLVLLAIMGTAFLAVSRADRQNVISRGASADGAKRALLRDASLFERLHALTEERVKQAILDDAFGNVAAKALDDFRTGSGAITAYGPTQPWLASLVPSLPLPTQPSNTTTNRPFWAWVSAPLTLPGSPFAEAQFADPRSPDASDPALRPPGRVNPLISHVAMPRSAATDPSGPRMYPGMQFSRAANANVYVAADADGDGVADSLLVPLVLNASLPSTNANRFLDASNNCIYYYAVRVVDNSAKVNVSTALSVRATHELRVAEGGATPSVAGSTVNANNGFWARIRARANTTSTTDKPNLGLFKSDVGFVELLDGLQSYYEASISAPIGEAVRQAEIDRLLNVRLPGVLRPNEQTKFDAFAGTVTQPNVSGVPNNNGATSSFMRTDVGYGMQLRSAAMPLTAAEWSSVPSSVATGSGVATFETLRYQSVGDYLENGVLRVSKQPLPWGFSTGSSALNNAQVLNTLPTSSGANIAIFRGSVLGSSEDAAALAFRGGSLRNTYQSQSSIEGVLSDSTLYSAPNFNVNQSTPWGYFPANEWKLWYDWTQDFRNALGNVTTPALNAAEAPYAMATPYTNRGGGQTNVILSRSLRPILTTESAVSDLAPTRTRAPEHATYGSPVTVDQHPPTRVPAATGSFKALYRAFFGAMTNPTPAATAKTANTSFDGDQLFRWGRTAGQAGIFSLGNGTNEMARLRSAIAAANTIAMRRIGDGRNPESVAATDNTFDRDIPALRVQLNAQYYARVFGVRPQPYISEVIASPGNGTSNSEVLYIELFNPYPFDINLAQYSIAAIERSSPSGQNGASVIRKATVTAGDPDSEVQLSGIIPAGGYRVFGFSDLPSAVNLTGVGVVIDGSNLRKYLKNEIALFRTRRGDGVLFQQVPAGSATRGQLVDAQLNETEVTTNPLTRVPLDMVDLRTLPPAATPAPTGPVPTPPDRPYVEYRRTTTGPNVDGDKWRVVYAGPMQRAMDPRKLQRPTNAAAYDPMAIANRESSAGDVLAIRDTTYSTNATVLASGRGSLGAANIASAAVPVSATMEPNVATFLAPVINLYFPNTSALAASAGISNGAAPFGTPFGRDGDVMNVPFIGSYIIERPDGTPVEFVPMSVDAVVADNNDGSDTTSGATSANRAVGRFDPQMAATSWATDLNAFVSARGSGARVLVPEIAPVIEGTAGVTASRTADAPIQGNESAANPALVRWVAFGTGASTASAQVTPVDLSTTALDADRQVRQTGRINVNTAPPAVLSMLPFVVDPTTGQVNLTANQAFAVQLASRQATPAQAITNLHQLRTLPGYAAIAASTREQLVRAGDLTPPPGGTAADLGDYKRETLNVARVSNLATTRSDVFTVYVTVQAWSYQPDGGGWLQTRDSRLIAEKRSAFVVDRTSIGPYLNGATLDVRNSIGDLKVIEVERE